jgi:predicted nucleotidyltransferase
MVEKIDNLMKKLETDNDIEILYSVEAGSRAWGFDSPDSDFDIRFIYKQKDYRKYLSLNEPKDTIDGFSEDRLYDWQGWDIKKALKLLRQSNPSLLEWLYDPIVYFNGNNNFKKKSIELIEKANQMRPLYYHYKSMAKTNYLKHIKDKQEVSCKKYLYVIRPAAMVFWLTKVKDRKFLKIEFDIIIKDLKLLISDELYENILKLIENKKLMLETDKCERIQCIDDWLDVIIFNKNEEQFDEDQTSKIDTKECDELFLELLGIN